MAVRWQISFETINHRHGLVKVYDSTYTGDVIDLEPADDAFSTSLKRSDIFDPVPSDTGYLRIMDNGIASDGIDDIHPLGGMDRPVEFYIDNALKWRGFISPESYDVGWESAPREVAFPLVGALAALKGVNMIDTGVGRQTIAAFFKEILTATGFSWTGIYFAPQLLYMREQDWPSSPKVFGEGRLELSRYNFLHSNDSEYRDDPDWTELVGDSYHTCLTEICRYFGFIAYQMGPYLVLDSPRRDIEYLTYITMAKLDRIIANPTASVTEVSVQRGEVSVLSLNWDGVQHRKSVSNGYRRVSVKSDNNISDDIYPVVDYKGKKILRYDADIDASDLLHYKARTIWLNADRERVKLHAYSIVDGQAVEIPWTAPRDQTGLIQPSGAIVRGDTWDADSDTGKTNYSYTNCLRLASSSTPNIHFAADIPLIEMWSKMAGVFPAGGALCISGTVKNSLISNYNIGTQNQVIDPNGVTQVGAYDNYLRLSIAIGDKYFNGTTWGDTETIIEVLAHKESGSYDWAAAPITPGPIRNRKTLSMPYNGANGFIIPIDAHMEGQIRVKFYPWHTDLPSSLAIWDFAAIFIYDFAIKYYTDEESDDRNGIALSALINNKFRDELSVDLKMSSMLDNKIGMGMLWYNGEPAAKFGYYDTVGFIRPELWLLRCLQNVYAAPSTQLLLEVTAPSLIPYNTLTLDDHDYMITGTEVSYANEHTKLTIVSYE